jgi:hypothetical protein
LCSIELACADPRPVPGILVRDPETRFEADTMTQWRDRPLGDAERRQLEARLANARRERALALVKTGAASALVCGALAVATLFASDAPRLVIIAFWGILAVVFTLWIGLPWHRLMRGQVPILEDALRVGRAREFRVQASRVVEFEEEEDEGACYAFELDPRAALFIVGQEFYEDDDFPNTDFSIVEILGTSGRPSRPSHPGSSLVPAAGTPPCAGLAQWHTWHTRSVS